MCSVVQVVVCGDKMYLSSIVSSVQEDMARQINVNMDDAMLHHRHSQLPRLHKQNYK